MARNINQSYKLAMPLVSFRFAVGLMLAMHFFGWLGMSWEVSRPFFVVLTPLNLIVSAYFLTYFQATTEKPRFWCFFGLTAGLGYLVEVLGVQTGLIFGEYDYGQVLGWKLFGVPPLIGLNWAVLVVLCGTFIARLPLSNVPKSLLTAAVLMLLDVLIEPVAVHFGWWTWTTSEVPLQNYLAWFLIAFGLAQLFFRGGFPPKNPFAPFLLIGQVFFFVALNLSIALIF